MQQQDGSFDIGPIPGLGGPFSTAKESLTAWAHSIKFPQSRSDMRKLAPPELLDDLIKSIENFPSRLEAVAELLPLINDGPFLLYHPDLYQSNIIIDQNYKILAVID